MAAFLLVLTLAATLVHLIIIKNWNHHKIIEVLASYMFLFCVGLGGLLGAYAHVFMGPEIARSIGWAPGSPFQFEMGMANLSYGILGVLAYWIRGRFWDATVIGWSLLLLGCFVGHVIDYYMHHNTAPLNIGPYIWMYDLFFPLILLALVSYLHYGRKN